MDYANYKEDFFKLLPFSYVLLIIFGVIHLNSYYLCFNIEIIGLLDLSEIITAYIIPIIAIIFSTGSVILTDFISAKKKEPISQDVPLKEDKTFLALKQKTTRRGKFWIIIKSFFIILLLNLVLPFFILIAEFNNIEIQSRRLLISLIILIAGVTLYAILYMVIHHKFDIYKTPAFKRNLIHAVMLFFIASHMVSFYARYEVYKVKDLNKYLGVEIIRQDNSTIISTEKYYYIGETKNYVFVYDAVLKKGNRIKMEDVKEIIFPESPSELNWFK